MKFNISAKKTFFIFSIFAILLFALDITLYLDILSKNHYIKEYYDEYLNITYETNIPTLFSALLSILTGLTAFFIYYEKKQMGWFISGIFFTYLGIDDGLQIHEYLGSFLGDIFLEDGFISYYWQVFFDPIFILIGLYIFLFLTNSFKQEHCYKCIIFLFLGFSFYAIAVGLDYYEGTDPDLRYFMHEYNLLYKQLIHIMRAIEEVIEMLGATMILSSLLHVHPLKIDIK